MATDELDTLLRRGEDLLAIKLVAEEWVAGAEALNDALRKARSADDPGAALRALEGPARELVTGLRRDRRTIAGAVDGLLDQARRVRMMPASTVFDLLPLTARDLAHSQGKRVTFESVGGEALVDRRVLEAIKDPLIHMVRNAVDHGLETPAEREAAGKPPQGRITASLKPLERGRLELTFTDDGRGIEPERVRDTATACFMGLGVIGAAALLVTGTDAVPDAGLLALLMPVVALGHLAGRPVFARLARRGGYEPVVTGVLLAAVAVGLAGVVI
jgi:two-component system chemotaxis sensor kinase CheA